MNATGYTKQELLDAIDDGGDVDILCTACEWLESATGCVVEDREYSVESIIAAIRAEDVSLLE